ncbi:MAG: ATP-binding protein [Geminocystis sp.]|nr:ATP-binding protein [Geminocystis sp.]HIK36743.1 response regulator [Geminocystis sp. M7585_C2015_104]MCS7146823.1 ATP-binding protein [Geminocystis sp.]MCX8077027.1 ATP-binding protein [Geminocystis sp.]MDW8115649.1 ATP-binding protein [Geminocystis sp.]
MEILIVEDELIAANSLAMDLKKLGFGVAGIVNTGKKAIAWVEKSPPDLILMDIMLRGKMDGIATAEAIYSRRQIPIIYLTAYTDHNTLTRAQSLPVYGYLVKPHRLEELKTTICMALAKFQLDKQIYEQLCKQKEANQIKGDAIVTAFHELRSHLTYILGYIEVIRDYSEKLSSEQKQKYFKIVISAVNEITDLLNKLLLVSRAEEGKIPLSPTSFELVSHLEKLIAYHQNKTARHRLILSTNKPICKVFLDQQMFDNIVHNLLSNAIKYSPKGGEIRVNVRASEAKNQVLLEVKDEGIGIPKKQLEKIFCPFVRGENVGDIKGHGLGLFIVKKSVDLLQGRIEVESEGNKGTTFRLFLPCQLPVTSATPSS